jgi:hypothetical protein
MSAARSRLRDAALDLAWRQWSELGISSWSEEPLIVLTAILGDADRRLLSQAVDWSAANKELVSLQQLNRVITQHRWPYKGAIAEFGATVGRFTRKKWPGVRDEQPLFLDLPDKTSSPDLLHPSLLGLRLRAILGLGARSEILLHLLFHDWPQTVRTIATETYYGERQVANDLQLLAAAGAVRLIRTTSQRTYQLDQRAALESFIGAPSARSLPLAALFRVTTAMVELEESSRLEHVGNPGAEFARHLRHLEPELDRLAAEAWWRKPDARSGSITDWLGWLAATLADGM